MIVIKNKEAIRKMTHAGQELARILQEISAYLVPGVTTDAIDAQIEKRIYERQLKPRCKGYCGYKHVSCVSVNDVIVHGVPSPKLQLQDGDLVTVDVCVSWRGYCADMARSFIVGTRGHATERIIDVAQHALDTGISYACPGYHIGDVGYHIQHHVEQAGYQVIRDFCGHGIGKSMHEDPDVPNHGTEGAGPRIRAGMAFAIEPMISAGSPEVSVDADGWTARTADGSLSAHVEDTVIVTEQGPYIATRLD